MGAYLSTCAICSAEFRADETQKPAYDASLGKGDRAETERLLGVINAHWALTFHMQAEHADAMFVCGRQGEGITRDPTKPGAYWKGDHTCSYCGSLSPEKFFEAVEAGCVVGPTDKSYKAYIDLPHEDPEGLRIVGATNGVERPGENWVAIADVDDDTLARSNWGRGGYTWVQFGKNGPTRNAKFYFQHLDQAGQDRFIELFNSKRMKIGMPGHFYARPYFCAPAGAA